MATESTVRKMPARPDDAAEELQAEPESRREDVEKPDIDPVALFDRVERLERGNRWLRYIGVVLALVVIVLAYDRVFPEGVTVHKTLLESKELKLLDADGNPRLFLRMYSRVPVLQLMDHKGKPRMSLGLRFDDSPFIDLSDKTGRTRATLEMTEHDAPALRLFDEHGNVKFQIN